MSSPPTTLSRFIHKQESRVRNSDSLLGIMNHLGLAGKIIARNLRRAGLIDILGVTGETNIQGEVVKKLDTLSNDIILDVMSRSGLVCAIASEELEKPRYFPDNWPNGRYVILFDPLDGSSNTDVNMPMGTIFSILRQEEELGPPSDRDLVRKGTEQVAAGYLMYGPSTILVFTSGQGVHGFTLDPDIGEYELSHEEIRIPTNGTVYAINEGNRAKWAKGVDGYLDYVKETDKGSGRPYSLRYSGCLVADVHRLLLTGGIYLYPAENDKPEGKLRLLYEANPLAMVVEQAGGRASTGMESILTIEAKSVHQRVPLFIGSRDDVIVAERFLQKKAKGAS